MFRESSPTTNLDFSPNVYVYHVDGSILLVWWSWPLVDMTLPARGTEGL